MGLKFADLLDACNRTALKLEFRDGYMTEDPGYKAWEAGNVDAAIAAYRDHSERMRAAVQRGVVIKRVRVVSVPVSRYIRFEHAVTDAVNIAAGELIRWLPRREASDLALPGNDAWIFDDRVVQFGHFAGDGSFVANEVTEAPEAVKLCSSAFSAAWARAVDHSDFSLS
ncbi:DUF6879 family protein [Catellatospora sp. NPDC049609]|uniref:DUF6879 family protein n=1 Tax=Catellatospora sp. NPDC049609 TaxID=3155505 RepID=UPI00341D8C8F